MEIPPRHDKWCFQELDPGGGRGGRGAAPAARGGEAARGRRAPLRREHRRLLREGRLRRGPDQAHPLGIIAAGYLFEIIGSRATLLICAGFVIVPTLLVLCVREVRELRTREGFAAS